MRGLAVRNVPTVLAFCSPYRAPWSPSMRTKTARRGPKRVGLLFFCVDELVTDLTYLSDDSIRRSYEHIRDELMADARSGTTFMGAAAKQRAEVLLTEIRRRGLNVPPIHWRD